jgi:hypothetical protein
MLGAAMSNIHWLDFNDAAEQTPEESMGHEVNIYNSLRILD